ncbi:FUSC family protein [Blautia sp.]|uniref:FUSC family protein n=1 Tax=Blautia sp. TaxID=1955243 RepID=UPI002E759979|nr:FUSC family protein [Blautia sp.]MEE0809993.1 FUSC family protein [Blautia sp.]
MTFYQELQLNQVGSKAVIRSAKTRKEKLRHTCIYFIKIAITMIFCMGFVMGFSAIFGDDNSIAGVVLLLFLMVFKNADFGIGMKDSLGVMGIIFAVLIVMPRLANSFGPLAGMAINMGCIFLLAFLSCHNLLMFNQSTVVLGYLLLYGYDASGKTFALRSVGLLLGAAATMLVFYRGHKNRTYKRNIKDLFSEFDIHSSRTQWQIALALGVSSIMCVVELLDLPRSMWAGIAAMSVMLPFEKDSKVRTKGRIPGNVIGGIVFLILYIVLPPSFLSYAGIIGGIGVGLSATYGWQSLFNSFGAMAVATSLIGLEGAIFFRIFHNICGSLYGQVFYKFFSKSLRRVSQEGDGLTAA